MAKSRAQRAQRGFTLFEILVATVVLAVGITGIYQAFFLSMNQLNHLTSRLYANILMDNQLTQLQQKFAFEGAIAFGQDVKQEQVTLGNKEIQYAHTVSFQSLEALEDIVEANCRYFWKEGTHERKLSQAAYLLKF